jgi:hypothetical protein
MWRLVSILSICVLMYGCVSPASQRQTYYPEDSNVVLSEQEIDERLINHDKYFVKLGLENYTAISGRLLSQVKRIEEDLPKRDDYCKGFNIAAHLFFFLETDDSILIEVHPRALPDSPKTLPDGSRTAPMYFGVNTQPAKGCYARYKISKTDGSLAVEVIK